MLFCQDIALFYEQSIINFGDKRNKYATRLINAFLVKNEKQNYPEFHRVYDKQYCLHLMFSVRVPHKSLSRRLNVI